MSPEVPSGADAVRAINRVFGGPYPGCRAAHARGLVCRGEFRPAAAARVLTEASFMERDRVPVTVRFSNASGDPGKPDSARAGRGMATRFHIDRGTTMDIVAVTFPCFFVRTPEDFIALNDALSRRPPLPADPLKAVRFLIAHRESWRAFWAVGRLKPVPSYANCVYNGLHSFVWTAPGGRRRHLRYSWVPEAGETVLGRDALRDLPRDYLSRELIERLDGTAPQPIRFTLELQLAPEAAPVNGSAQNPLNDPTKVWRRDRVEVVTAGDLELTSLAEVTEELAFDPVPEIDGIGPSADRILAFRRSAYKVSADARKVGAP
jgi:catalase